MVTGNYKLKVIFTGTEASITTNQMYIPPLENTEEAFSLAKFLVAHESAHELFSIMDLKKKASEKSILLGDILNSLQDARIERLITQRFEGLDALFDAEVRKIIDGRAYSKVPLSVQVLNGLYMIGKGYDISPITKQAQDLIYDMKDLVEKAVNAKDNRGVLKISEQIYERLKHLDDGSKTAKPDSLLTGANSISGNNIPDMVMESLDKHKLDQDYDNMGDYPFLKDENADEEETEIIPDKYDISEYLPLIRSHTRELTKDAGVELLGLGINTNFMSKYFQRFTELTDLNRFGE